MKFPLVSHLLKGLFRRPDTNPFPVKHLPDKLAPLLEDPNAPINPPVPFPPGGRANIAYDAESCIGCGMCSRVCPAHAIEVLPKQKKIRLFRGNCIACAQCVEICPKKSLSVDSHFLQADVDRYSDALVAR